MARPRIHLIAPAGSCGSFVEGLGLATATELIALCQNCIGDRYEATADAALLAAAEDESNGGRTDDRRRASDIEQSLADSNVVSVVALRGGAWFTRVLPLIDFSVIDRRIRPVAVFGFSELTTLVNIVASYAQGVGVYDMTPASLFYGLKRYAKLHPDEIAATGQPPEQWVREQLHPQFRAFFLDLVAVIEGRGTGRPIVAELVDGELPERLEATFTGGNLTVLSTLIGSPYERSIRPDNTWLVIEDYNDKVERIDRFLAHLTLSGFWEDAAGVLLGDFHQRDVDLTSAIRSLLPFHLPPGKKLPMLVTRQVGHTWPMSPLPLGVVTTLTRTSESKYSISWPSTSLRVITRTGKC